MTDAAHLLSDVSGFGVAVFAGFYAAKKSQSTHTFGYGATRQIHCVPTIADSCCSRAPSNIRPSMDVLASVEDCFPSTHHRGLWP